MWTLMQCSEIPVDIPGGEGSPILLIVAHYHSTPHTQAPLGQKNKIVNNIFKKFYILVRII